MVWYHDFRYQVGSWDRPRRVVAKIEHHKGELCPRVGFIVTNLCRPSWRVVKFYNGRGTAEQWMREGKNAVNWTMLREKLIKIGAKVVTHARYVIFEMAGVAVPKRLFRAILERMRRLRLLPVLARAG